MNTSPSFRILSSAGPEFPAWAPAFGWGEGGMTQYSAASYTFCVSSLPILLQMSKRISKTLESTAFSGALIVPVAAKPGGPDAPPSQGALGIDNLVQVSY